MNKIYLSTTLLLLFFSSYLLTLNAQVTGLSYTLSPTAEYVWWDDRAGLENNYLVGGKLGFGFGEYLELRALYMQSLDLQTDFTSFDIENIDETLFQARYVDLTRIGGEIKANLSGGNLLPFIVVGGGVQTLQLGVEEAPEQQQIYLNLGVGVKFSLADRYTLQVQANNTRYNFNAGDNFLTADDKLALSLPDGIFTNEELQNWSVQASLQFYLGGRRPGNLSEIDKAYFKSLNGGFQGLRGTLEPVVGRTNFNDMLPYRDTWLAGGSAGIDIGSYLELRGFYLRALEEGETTQFDELGIYGGELRMKLNSGGGILPYLIVGGGNIDVNEEYIGKTVMLPDGQDSTLLAEDRGFIMGGGGIVLPISRNVKIFGSARAMLTSASDLEDVQQPDQLNTSWLYSAGFRLTLGKKAADPDLLINSQLNSALADQQAVNEANATTLKNQYEAKVVELERQLNEAYAQQDVEKAARIRLEKDKAEQVVAELESRERSQFGRSATYSNGSSYIQMSAAELESLIEEILVSMGASGSRISPAIQQEMNTNRVEALLKEQEMKQQIEAMEDLLKDIQQQQQLQNRDLLDQLNKDFDEFRSRLLDAVRDLDDKMDDMRRDLRSLELQNSGVDTRSGNATNPPASNTLVVPNDAVVVEQNQPELITEYIEMATPDSQSELSDNSVFRSIRYKGMSSFAGFNLGGGTTANLGFRWHYGLGSGPFELMPETFFGFGAPASFGITANVVLPFNLGENETFRPYIGTGGGFMQIADNGDEQLKGAFNIIIGSYVNVWKGRMYVDLTGRNVFRNNQLVVGYRFPF
ncbi:MAG: hypothetical protein AAGI23_10635 [Bacteroidota bacterium]